MPHATPLPDNLLRLHAHEESLREAAVAAIAADPALADHLSAIERTMDLCHYVATHGEAGTDDDRALRRLDLRLFNAFASLLKLALSGYCQVAVASLRDAMETSLLLDYLQRDPAEIARWRTLQGPEHWRRFKPAKIRKALVPGDGPSSLDRDYGLLCALGTHPSMTGPAVQPPVGADAAVMGPSVDRAMLGVVLKEGARQAVLASSIVGHLPHAAGAEMTRFFASIALENMDWANRHVGDLYTDQEYAEVERMALHPAPE